MYVCVCSLHKRLTKFEHEMKWEAVLMVMFILISISPKWRRRLWSIEAGRALIRLLVGLISMRTTLFIIIFVESYS